MAASLSAEGASVMGEQYRNVERGVHGSTGWETQAFYEVITNGECDAHIHRM